MDSRQRIINEAALMFRAYGIRAVTMDMLSSRLGISKRTLYEVFRDKDELLRGVMEWMSEMQKELMDKIMNDSENIIEAIFKMLRIMSDHYKEMSPAFKMDMKRFYSNIPEKDDLSRELPHHRQNSEILKRGIREGVFRDDIDIEITNRCLTEFSKLSQESDSASPDTVMDEDVMRNIFINYMRGISTPKGLELINYHAGRGDEGRK